jgi:flagellar motor switch protein FliN
VQAPYSWIRKVADHVAEADRVPLYGNAPAFDWGTVSEKLAACFEMPVKLGEKKQQWRSAEELKEGLGESCFVIPLRLSPLSGHAFWMMSREQMAKFTSWMLSGKANAQPLSSEILAEGFYRFLLLQTLNSLSETEPLQKFALSLAEEISLPHASAFCIDVELSFERRSCWGRLAIEPKLQQSWVAHFAANPSNLLQSKAAAGLELSLGVQVGSMHLTKKEWQSFKKGDFAPLNRGNIHHGTLMLGSIPLFQAKIKHHKLQLLDDPFTHEETMEKKSEEHSEEPKPVSLKELPMHVSVEIARLKMTLEKLLQLEPGNLIEIPIDPNQSVRLVVDGQLIGHGELVHLGDSLGVRLLDKG